MKSNKNHNNRIILILIVWKKKNKRKNTSHTQFFLICLIEIDYLDNKRLGLDRFGRDLD